jgi:hypothetical protein
MPSEVGALRTAVQGAPAEYPHDGGRECDGAGDARPPEDERGGKEYFVRAGWPRCLRRTHAQSASKRSRNTVTRLRTTSPKVTFELP